MRVAIIKIYFGIGLAIIVAAPSICSAISVPQGKPQTSLTVSCDLPCAIALDDAGVRFLSGNRAVKVQAPAGSHRLRAITLDGKDSWEGSTTVTLRPQKRIFVSLLSVRRKREADEALLTRLGQELNSKKDQLQVANRELQAVKNAYQEKMLQRQKSDELRKTFVDYIVQLEGVMQYESREISRLQQEVNSTNSAPGNAPASLGGLINAIGQVHSQSLQGAIERHDERIKRLLKRVDDLTKELGGIRNGQSASTSIPPWTFEASKRDGKHDEPSTLAFSNGHFALASASVPTSPNQTVYGCTDVKHVNRDRSDSITVEVAKKKLLLHFQNPDTREAAIERWYAVCPQVVNW